jgi:GT2 family glycosyltransferase
VVASYNGGATLRTCLESLGRLNYPNYEVILVDDGSTDHTPQIVADFPSVRTIRQSNCGLSAARNTGIAAAQGEIVAFTDSDCRADEDWLFYLVGDLLRSGFAGMGGHNFLPPEDSAVAAAVLVSPGGPAHVMLSDREAEHIPGCNMAFYKWALELIQGFDLVFRKAGDDVDVCWRLHANGCRTGFSHAGFVWHYRRSTVKAYLKQQAGYGEAEAVLAEKHPEYFNGLGGGIWRGRIYSPARAGVIVQRPVIYHGIFGTGFFQRIYGREPSIALLLSTSMQFHLCVTLPLAVVSGWFPAIAPVAMAALALSAGTCVAAACQADVPADKSRLWTRPLIACLFFLQPIVRGFARYKQRISPTLGARRGKGLPPSSAPRELIGYWSKAGVDRYAFLARVQAHISGTGWASKWDSGWDNYDLGVTVNRWSTANLITATEELSRGRKFIRCQINAGWSWSSWTMVLATALLSVVAAVLLAPQQPLAWFLLACVPLVIILIEDRRWQPLLALSDAVELAAKELGLERYEREAKEGVTPE